MTRQASFVLRQVMVSIDDSLFQTGLYMETPVYFFLAVG